jgi:hypothetical protein
MRLQKIFNVKSLGVLLHSLPKGEQCVGTYFLLLIQVHGLIYLPWSFHSSYKFRLASSFEAMSVSLSDRLCLSSIMAKW